MGFFDWISPKRKGHNKADSLLSEAIAVYQRAAMRKASSSDIDHAIESCAQALELYSELGKKDGEVRSYNIQGGLYRCVSHLADSIKCEKKALDIVRNIAPNSESVGQSLNNLADLNRESYLPEPLADDQTLESFVSALRYAVDACKLFERRHPSSQWFPMGLFHLGRILAEFGDIKAGSLTILTAQRKFISVGNHVLADHCAQSLQALNSYDQGQNDKKRTLGEYLLSKRADKAEVQELLMAARRISK